MLPSCEPDIEVTAYETCHGRTDRIGTLTYLVLFVCCAYERVIAHIQLHWEQTGAVSDMIPIGTKGVLGRQ